jgi:hypothetical protein
MMHIVLYTPCITLYVAVSYFHFFGRPRRARTRGGRGASTAEETILEQDQGKPRCI